MFRFKQFTIRQDRTAMKVCTDACVLGAWADVGRGGRLLDIGTGTGLLALMAAQRNPEARIEAVEADEAAAGQAAGNVRESPFADRVRVVPARIQDVTTEPFDRILSNPPFYTGHLRSPDAAVNRALHNDELPFEELISSIVRLLKRDGECWVMLPPSELQRFSRLAEAAGLRPYRTLALRHHARKPVFRMIAGLRYDAPAVPDRRELCLYEPDGKTYTAGFRSLLQPFYLIF
ncbi:tRNA1(Val) (adenine(37)-N6)-methyltransferase [Larkinella soli]|uniref:tRNA1(Val) (adenine(37)-N6)-methyltransferase n=1 Tax=Larkinella soli TaxID=1770527 RepID=UPI000FFB8D1A|nr:methyltransferase [Larkinella soli]